MLSSSNKSITLCNVSNSCDSCLYSDNDNFPKDV